MVVSSIALQSDCLPQDYGMGDTSRSGCKLRIWDIAQGVELELVKYLAKQPRQRGGKFWLPLIIDTHSALS